MPVFLERVRRIIMAVTERITHTIDNPAFNGVEFTEHSKEYLAWPKAVKFAAERGGILQSAREAGAFRVDANGEHNANDYQATRAVALGFKVGNKFYFAIDDTIDPAKNIVIARVQEGYDRHNAERKFLLPVTDALVKGALLRAEKTGRIVEANTASPLELKTKAVSGKSEFGQNDWNKAILLDVAEPYAQMLSQSGYDIGHVWSLTPETLERIGVNGNFVEVRPVGFGCFSNFSSVVADDLFDYCGRSCGVRGVREFSICQKLPSKYKKVRQFLSMLRKAH
jgi:hypothetical protein